MADVYSDIATIENSPTPATHMSPNICRGKVRAVSGSYTAASLADTSVIALCRLYAGDVVLLGGSWVGTEDTLGSARTVSVGDDDSVTAADPDRYLAATSIAAAGVLHFIDLTTKLSVNPYVVQETCWCTATVGGLWVAGDLRFQILIASEN